MTPAQFCQLTGTLEGIATGAIYVAGAAIALAVALAIASRNAKAKTNHKGNRSLST
jgi:cytochrome c biogenesis protein CcdA